jgi:hypothetical protein
VKIELIKGGNVVKVFLFDGTGSTNMNWFDKQRLVKSSFCDLSKSSTTNFFSIIGYANFFLFLTSTDPKGHVGYCHHFASVDVIVVRRKLLHFDYLLNQ